MDHACMPRKSLEDISETSPAASGRVTARKAQKSARKAEKAARKARTTLEFFSQASFMTDEQVGDFDCNTATTNEGFVSCVSTVADPCEQQQGVQSCKENDVQVKYGQKGATGRTNDCNEGVDGDACSAVRSMVERSDTIKEGIANGAREEPLGNENGCVYYPCAPGEPLQKFWPVLVNGEQFYTDETQQLFKLACMPVLAVSETNKIDSDEQSTSAEEDGVSTASDLDMPGWGVAMTRSHSEPSFPTRWIE